MEIDVRTGAPAAVTAIRFSQTKALVGAVDNDVIVLRDETGAQMELCRKGQLAELTAALQMARKIW